MRGDPSRDRFDIGCSAGELIPVSRLGRELAENQTAIRLIPSIKPSAAVALGSFVSVWQVVEVEGIFQPEQLVARAEWHRWKSERDSLLKMFQNRDSAE